MSNNFNHHVGVFHFTSRISSAKIRKYKIATERGMGPGGELGGRANSALAFPTPAPQVPPAGTLQVQAPSPTPVEATPAPSAPPSAPSATSAPSAPSPSMEPPAKKPKLKLTVRQPGPEESPAPTPAPPDAASDSIAVARPRRESSLRIRYSENMVLEDESLRIHSDSSDLSSVASTPPPPPSRKSAKDPTPASANPEYGDFMSYYVLDGEDEEKPKAKPPPKPKPKPRTGPRSPKGAARPGPLTQPHSRPPVESQMQMHIPGLPRQFENHGPGKPRIEEPPRHYSRPQQARLPPPPPPPPVPQVQLIDFDFVGKTGGDKQPCTVLQMIRRLEDLSASLTNFGGVPPAPRSPRAPNVEKPAEKGKKRKQDDPLDSFLGMFEDEESSEGDQSPKKPDEPVDTSAKLDYLMQNPGAEDGPLTYGIQFIQNALKSWATQRLQHQYAAQFAQQGMHQQYQQQKRGPGRPRKFMDGEEDRTPQLPPQPHIIQVRAESTQEGMAIRAFQQMLESGCLQMNAVFPQELTRALRHLYMQIDHLINQGAKSEPQWQCMSYGAQIAANKGRVEKWREAQSRAQEEMARQQQLAQQQVMQQMGLPVQSPQASATQAQQQHAIDLERRRNSQHAAQQPYLSQHHLNPLLLGSQPPGTPVGFAPSPTPANGMPNGSPANKNATPAGQGLPQNGMPNSVSKPSSPATPVSNGKHMEKITVYQADCPQQPRPGTQMKFSFAANHPDHVRAFGAGAFPTASIQGSNIPNRGPMSDSPVTRGPVVAEIVPSIETPSGQNGPAKATNGGTHDDVEMTGVTEVKSKGQGVEVEIKKETEAPAPAPAGGFTAVNAPAATPASPTVSKANGEVSVSDASQYPHPGAVVVDQ